MLAVRGPLAAVFDIAHGFAETVATEASSKAAGGIVSFGASATLALGRAIVARDKTSKARRKFDESYSSAESDNEREAAIRQWLNSDPHFARIVGRIIAKRDLLSAVATYCDSLPELGNLLDGLPVLSEFFVEPELETSIVVPGVPEDAGDASEPHSRMQTVRVVRAQHDFEQGNHFVAAHAGAGKSTYCRHLVARWAKRILADPDALSIDNARLPVLIEAKMLAEHNCGFMEAVRKTLEAQLSIYAIGGTPAALFDPRDVGGFPNWLIVIDGKHQRRPQSVSRRRGFNEARALLCGKRPVT